MNSDRYKTSGRVRDPARLGACWISQLDNHCCNCRSDCSDRQPRHRFLEPIHNVKDGASRPYRGKPRIRFLHSWKRWWSQSGSNRRPQACKASALPTELWPHSHAQRRKSAAHSIKMVGRVGVEPTTSRLSGVRSNHLSYRPPLHLTGQMAAGG